MDDPTVGLMAVIPVPMAQKLLRLRELRAAQARKTALLCTQEAHAGWEDVKRSQTVLDSHRKHWRAVEAEGTARMNRPLEHGTVSPQALRDRHDHLGALADRAIALQKDVGLRATWPESRTRLPRSHGGRTGSSTSVAVMLHACSTKPGTQRGANRKRWTNRNWRIWL